MKKSTARGKGSGVGATGGILLSPRSAAATQAGWLQFRGKKHWALVQFGSIHLSRDRGDSLYAKDFQKGYVGSICLRSATVLPLSLMDGQRSLRLASGSKVLGLELTSESGTRLVFGISGANQLTADEVRLSWWGSLRFIASEVFSSEEPSPHLVWRGHLRVGNLSTGRVRFVIIRGVYVSWYSSASDVVPMANLNLAGWRVSRHPDEPSFPNLVLIRLHNPSTSEAFDFTLDGSDKSISIEKFYTSLATSVAAASASSSSWHVDRDVAGTQRIAALLSKRGWVRAGRQFVHRYAVIDGKRGVVRIYMTEEEVSADPSYDPNVLEVLPLAGAYANIVPDDPFTLRINIPVVTNEGVTIDNAASVADNHTSTSLVGQTGDRTLHSFSFNGPVQTKEWVEALTEAVTRASVATEKVTRSPRLRTVLRGYLQAKYDPTGRDTSSKNMRQTLCVLTRHTLSFFADEASEAAAAADRRFGLPGALFLVTKRAGAGAASSALVRSSKPSASADPMSAPPIAFELISPNGSRVHLALSKDDPPSVGGQWSQALLRCMEPDDSTDAKATASVSAVFGVSLDLLAARGSITRSTPLVAPSPEAPLLPPPSDPLALPPYLAVVEAPVSFLLRAIKTLSREDAMTLLLAPTIPDPSQVARIQNAFDAGGASSLPATTPPALAMALLREWLLALPTPLLPDSFLDDMHLRGGRAPTTVTDEISNIDVDIIRNSIDSLSSITRLVLRRLAMLWHDAASVTSAVAVAAAFGPLVLRPDDAGSVNAKGGTDGFTATLRRRRKANGASVAMQRHWASLRVVRAIASRANELFKFTQLKDGTAGAETNEAATTLSLTAGNLLQDALSMDHVMEVDVAADAVADVDLKRLAELPPVVFFGEYDKLPDFAALESDPAFQEQLCAYQTVMIDDPAVVASQLDNGDDGGDDEESASASVSTSSTASRSKSRGGSRIRRESDQATEYGSMPTPTSRSAAAVATKPDESLESETTTTLAQRELGDTWVRSEEGVWELVQFSEKPRRSAPKPKATAKLALCAMCALRPTEKFAPVAGREGNVPVCALCFSTSRTMGVLTLSRQAGNQAAVQALQNYNEVEGVLDSDSAFYGTSDEVRRRSEYGSIPHDLLKPDPAASADSAATSYVHISLPGIVEDSYGKVILPDEDPSLAAAAEASSGSSSSSGLLTLAAGERTKTALAPRPTRAPPRATRMVLVRICYTDPKSKTSVSKAFAVEGSATVETALETAREKGVMLDSESLTLCVDPPGATRPLPVELHEKVGDIADLVSIDLDEDTQMASTIDLVFLTDAELEKVLSLGSLGLAVLEGTSQEVRVPRRHSMSVATGWVRFTV